MEDEEAMDRETAWGLSVRKARGWKAPGPDFIFAYWWKALRGMAGLLRNHLWKIMDGDEEMPRWFAKGRTVLLPKDGCEGRPEQFRPITCLNTAYKLYTGALAAIITAHIHAEELLPTEQKALRRGRRGCLDAIVINGAVAGEARHYERDLSMAWVDFKKAYDMVPHRWLKRILKATKIRRGVRKAVTRLVPLWETTLTVETTEKKESFPICFRRGLFQGDSLSPLLFCLSIAPLSHQLRKQRGFRSIYQGRVTHLLFMDDLKIFAESREEVRDMTAEAEEVSQALGMRFGVAKCAAAHVKRGRLVGGSSMELQTGTTIPEMQYGDTYKYLGVAQLFGTNLAATKTKIRKEYIARMRKVWGGATNSLTKARNHNSWCVALFRYFFGVVRWSRSELIQMDRRMRRIMAQNGCHHIGAAPERLYQPRMKGGRGLQSLLMTWEREAVSVVAYLQDSEDEQVQGAMRLQEVLEQWAGTVTSGRQGPSG